MSGERFARGAMIAIALAASLLVMAAAFTAGPVQELCATAIFVLLVCALVISVLEARLH